MNIKYVAYRSKNPDEKITERSISFPIENNDQMALLDDFITAVLTKDIQNLDIIKKFGTAYIGRVGLLELEVVEEDDVAMTETEFRAYCKQINPLWAIVWSKKDKTTLKSETNKK